MHKIISIIPQPISITHGIGNFELLPSVDISASSNLLSEANYLARRLRCATGFPIALTEGQNDSSTKAAIVLSLDKNADFKNPEGYRLVIESERIRMDAATPAGIFYAIQTLLQIFPAIVFSHGPRAKVEWTLPCLTVEDYPRFSWRGAMLDCSRHFKPVSFVKKFIDILALHKLNRFHWHLTDDQGWRIEIKKYPRLTEVGAWRRESIRGHLDLNLDGDGIPHGGYYSQDDIRDIVSYAADRHVTIIPEIEMPGHAQAAIAAYPELGCTEHRLDSWTRWGVSESIFNPNEETILFLQDVLKEVMDLFPSQFIHIGGDEATKKQWNEKPEILSLMAELGIEHADGLQSYFVKRMDKFLTEHGRRLIGWDEILEGGLAASATVMSWRGMEGGIAAAKAGHDVVMAPCQYTYLDSYQSSDIRNEPLAIGGEISLEKVYSYEPVPTEIPSDKIHHVLGLQGQLWAEYMPTTDIVEYMAFPRLCALAEVGWICHKTKNYSLFQRKLQAHLKRLDILGVKYRHPCFTDGALQLSQL